MPPLLQFVIRRLFYAVVSLIVITMVLYAGVMLTPPEARAQLFCDRAGWEFAYELVGLFASYAGGDFVRYRLESDW